MSPNDSSVQPNRVRRAIIGLAVLGTLLGGLTWLTIYAVRTSKRISDEKAAEVAPYLQHVSFTAELRNTQRFAGPFYIVDPTGRTLPSDVGDMPFSVGNASTLVVCRLNRSFIGEYHYMESGRPASINAYRITAEMCFIDLKDPKRRRFLTAVSEPPKVIQSEKEYEEQAIHKFDDQPHAERGKHEQYGLVAKAIRYVTAP